MCTFTVCNLGEGSNEGEQGYHIIKLESFKKPEQQGNGK